MGTTARVGAPHNVNVTPQIEVGSSREGIWMLSHYATPTTVVRVSGFVVIYLLFIVIVVVVVTRIKISLLGWFTWWP